MLKKIVYNGAKSLYPLQNLNNSATSSTSVMSVVFDREALENVRKSRNISVSSLGKKIGLSRSRYYRFLTYEIDLPFDTLVSMQKLLVLTNSEFLNMFGTANDAYIMKAAGLSYFSLLRDKDRCLLIRDSIQKHSQSSFKNDPYLVLIDFADLCVAYTSIESSPEIDRLINQIFDKLFVIDNWTTIDILMIIAVFYMVPFKGKPYFSDVASRVSCNSLGLSSYQKSSFLFDIFCLAVDVKNKSLASDMGEKIISLDAVSNDLNIHYLKTIVEIVLDNWNKMNKLTNGIKAFINQSNLDQNDIFAVSLKRIYRNLNSDI